MQLNKTASVDSPPTLRVRLYDWDVLGVGDCMSVPLERANSARCSFQKWRDRHIAARRSLALVQRRDGDTMRFWLVERT